MANKDLVVVGASSGGIAALRALARTLPADLKAAIMIVLHTGPHSPDLLDAILAREGRLPARNANDGDAIEPGHIYVARSDHHLIVDRSGVLRLSRGPKENRFRPAVDVLFRSAAVAFGSRVVGVILSGALDDGTAGLWAIKARGGTAIVQRPDEAEAPGMPTSALRNVDVDYCVPVAEMGPILTRLSQTPAKERPAGDAAMEDRMAKEVKIANQDTAQESGILEWGEPSIFTCPECHGVLLQLTEGSNLRFRCHTGHAYSIETLLAEYDDENEETLWAAIRSLEETIMLLRTMGDNMAQHGHSDAAAVVRQKVAELTRRADAVRTVVLDGDDEVAPR
jgi:two-component system, chemotaxis family, protein-glutamate methylesterase/glutaminase